MICDSLREWRAAARSFTDRGHRLAYWADFESAGSGAPLLLLIHGFPTSSWDWHAMWPQLVERFRVVALDMLGFGLSDKPADHTYSLMEQADLHEALLAHLGVRSCHVLAHDYGDSVAQELLARHTEDGGRAPALLSVCFLNGGLIPGVHRPRPIQRLLAGPLGPLVARLLDERRFRRSFARVFGPQTQPSDRFLADAWALIRERDGHRIAHRLIRYMHEREVHRDRWVDVLAATRVPLCLIGGALDPVSGAPMLEAFRSAAPLAHVVELAGVGHYPQVEAADATLAAHASWLAPLLR